MPAEVAYEIGVDTGGTFTDVVCRGSDGSVRILKVPSTRSDPGLAIMQAVQQLGERWGIAPSAVSRFAHGTTVATNAVLERKGSRIGLLATEGFRDILEIGRQMRSSEQMYAFRLRPEAPVFLARRSLRLGVRERIGPKGEVIRPLDRDSLIGAIDELAAAGVEAIAVAFLFSFVNPAHEIEAGEEIRRRHAGIRVSLSHEVDPAFREYERTAVTAFDAYVRPTIDRYLTRLESALAEVGVAAPLQVMQSRGGLAAAAVARQRPVRLFLSGPAAGVIGGSLAGDEVGEHDLITVDVGGTSCDIALIGGGKPMIKPEGVIAGFPVRVGMVDVNSIGSGGGSIAWIDGGGGLRVGPESAGSEPGPACYGRGGAEATVTDASIVLGYLDPDYFAAGTVKLDPALAHEVIRKRVAKPLGLSVEQAALGIHRVLNAQMAEGIRLVSIRQGIDPRGFALLPLGGGGAIHATALADELAIGRIIVPRHPGVLSAAGLLSAKVEHEVSAAHGRPLANLDLGELRRGLEAIDRRAASLMAVEKAMPEQTTVSYFADVCYEGQAYFLEVPIDLAQPDPASRLYEEFLVAHDRVYGFALRNPARLVNLRTVHRAGRDSDTRTHAATAREPAPKPGTRRALFRGQQDYVAVPVIRRQGLTAGSAVAGPAIIEQEDTTLLVEPGWHVSVGAGGNLLLTRSQDGTR